MTAMNDLIEGRPQRVQSGAILLALSAWHLYPDISVQSTSLRFIKQADPLVDQGGIITVGLQNRTNHSEDGVYWSLPLAHLKVYGKPVIRTQHYGISHTQITFAQFLCVTLGSLFGLWRILDSDLDVAAEIMCRLAEVDETVSKCHHKRKAAGIGILGRAAQLYLSSKGSLRDEYARLLAYGRRRCSTFLSNKDESPLQFFGLAHFPIAFSPFSPYSVRRPHDEHADILRQWAYNCGIDLTGTIICYKNDDGQLSCTSGPETQTAAKKEYSSAQIPSHQTKLHWNASEIEDENLCFEEPIGGGLQVAVWKRRRFLAPGPGQQPVLHDFMYGDPSVAAIYRPSKTGYQLKVENRYLRPKELLGLLRDCRLSNLLLSNQIKKNIRGAGSRKLRDSLRALDFAGRIYEYLNDAKIDMQVCLRALYASHFARHHTAQDLRIGTEKQDSSDMAILSLKLAFSCIILFQTGRIDVNPEDLEGAMAISHNDSIFVAQSILVDPSHSHKISPVRRIIGNVGKPGLVILIPAHAPEVRERSIGDWRVVNHAPFDGKYEDNFGSTSLHLTFTGYVLPIDVGERGSLTHEAHIAETVISVYDAGEWVADLDVLKAISHYKHGWTDHANTDMKVTLPPLVAIDNWQEILDNPESSAVVRACGNEQARLAIVTVASQLGYRFRIIGPGDQPKYEREMVQSPSRSEHYENTENDSKGELHGGPEVLPTSGDYDPWDMSVYDDNEPGPQHELDIAEMPLSEDGTTSCHSFEKSKNYQHIDGVLYIC